MSDMDIQRRQFLKTSVGAAAVAVAPGMLLFDMAHGKSEPVSSKVRWGMLIDTENCADVRRLREGLQQGKRFVRRFEPDRLAMDTQGRTQGHAQRADLHCR